MNLVLMTQYFDMLKEIGASSRTNAILIPHSPGNLASLTEQMRNAMMEADQTGRASQAGDRSFPEIRAVADERHAPRGTEQPATTVDPHGNGGQSHVAGGAEERRR